MSHTEVEAGHLVMMTPEEKDELLWVRSQIESLEFSRTTGGLYTAEDVARYHDLCRQEADLLRRMQAA